MQRAIVLHPDGKVLGQFGFSSAAEVMTACALAAAINASGKELGRQLGGRPFLGLHQGGQKQGVFMGSCAAAGRSACCSPHSIATARLVLCDFTSPNSGMRLAVRTTGRGRHRSGRAIWKRISTAVSTRCSAH